MNQHPQRQAPASRPIASTPAEARKLAEDMVEVMSGLLAIIERETELVRAGKVREALRLEEQKTELSRRYMVAVENLKNAQAHLKQVAPELLATLRRHHETFRAMLQINLTVLATAHAVSEGIVRGVNRVAVEALGYSEEELVGHSVMRVVHPQWNGASPGHSGVPTPTAMETS